MNNTIKQFFPTHSAISGFDIIFGIQGYVASQDLPSSQFRPLWPDVHTHWPFTHMPPFWH